MLKYLNKMKKLNIVLTLFFCSLMVLCQRANKDSGIFYNNRNFTTDTISAKENTILLIYPSDKTINSLKKKLGDDFYIVADDANYYSANIMEHLDSLDTPYINVSDSIKIIIKNSKGQKREIKVNGNKNLYWYAILYDVQNNDYKVSSLVDFENTYKKFYRKP